jgi:hypothetical protein
MKRLTNRLTNALTGAQGGGSVVPEYKSTAAYRNVAAAYITLGQNALHTAALDPTREWTLDVTVCRTTAAAAGYVFSKGGSTAGQRQIGISTAGGGGYTVEVGGVTVISNFGTEGFTRAVRITVVNRDSGGGVMKTRMILNGRQVSTENPAGNPGTFVNSTHDFLIGARRNASNADSTSNWAATIDELKIFNVALTDAEVSLLAGDLRTPKVTRGIVSWYKLGEELTGTTVYDSIGGVNGTLVGSGVLDTARVPKAPIITYGDSIGLGSGGTSGFMAKLPLRDLHYNFIRCYSGQGSTYVKGIFDADTDLRSWFTIIEVGRNGVLTDTGTILSDIQGMVAQLPHNRWVVIGITKKYDGTEDTLPTPTANATKIDQVNAAVQAWCGSRWLDLQAYFLAHGNGTTDNTDVALGRCPTTLRGNADLLYTHFNDTAYTHMSQMVSDYLDSIAA